MSDLSEHPAVAEEKAGLVLVEPEPANEHGEQLLLDIDDEASAEALTAALQVLSNNGVTAVVEKWTTSAGGNRHAYVRVMTGALCGPQLAGQPFSMLWRIALQACLGSDRKRELFSLLRIGRAYDIPAVCFFEKPDADVHKAEEPPR